MQGSYVRNTQNVSPMVVPQAPQGVEQLAMEAAAFGSMAWRGRGRWLKLT